VSKTVSTRLDENEIQKLNEIANEEHLDRSALIRKFLLDQVKLHEMARSAEHYRKGVASLQEAATMAGVSLYDMMDFVEKEKIRPPVQSTEEIDVEIQDAIDNAKKINGT
jgi:predicted HTH domain antitoxin